MALMSSIIPSLGTAVAGATQPNVQQIARESPASTQTAASIAVGAQAADKSANRAGKDPKTNAPAAQKRVESTFAARSAAPRPVTEQTAGDEPRSTHDGKLDVVA
jgi:hypothetical protein